jgi:hypothetical protein
VIPVAAQPREPPETEQGVRAVVFAAGGLAQREALGQPPLDLVAGHATVNRPAGHDEQGVGDAQVVADPAEQRQALPPPAERFDRLAGGEGKGLQRPRALPGVLVIEQGSASCSAGKARSDRAP